MGEAYKNDVPSFKRFLEKFCQVIEKRTDGDDEIPIRLAPSFLIESEIEGECLDWLLQYLASNKCPGPLATWLARCVCDEILAQDLSQLYEESESFQATDTHLHVEKRVSQVDCHRLARLVFLRLYDVCEQWNHDLPHIPSPDRHYEVYSHAIKNTRRKMEDRHVIIPDLNSLFKLKNCPNQSYYAVFDGHGGVEAAIYTASHLHCHMISHPDFDTDPETAIKHAYNTTDNMFLEKAQREGLRSGSTCVTALIRDQRLHLAWLGDSQAVLVKGGQLYDVMDPHKPERADEKKRIEDLGGVVVWFGTWRVNGNIAVSRAIGDIEHKPYISGEPDVLSVDLDGTEDYLILGCDGVWDTISKEELPEIMYTYLQECDGDRTMVAQRLVSIARDNGSTDNISVVIIFFKDQISEPKPATSSVEEKKKTEAGDGDSKGDNSDGKENDYSELAPHDNPESSSGLNNGTGSEKTCRLNCNLSLKKQESSRKSRKDQSCRSAPANKRGKTQSKPQQKKPMSTNKPHAEQISQSVNIKKPLRSISQVNTPSHNKTRSKSSTSRNKKTKSKPKTESENKETVWAFTGKAQPRVQNHRLNQRNQIVSKPSQISKLGPSQSYLSKDWLSKTMTRIMSQRRPTGVSATNSYDDTATLVNTTTTKSTPWYVKEQEYTDSTDPTEEFLSGEAIICGSRSMLHQNQGREFSLSGIQYQQGNNRVGNHVGTRYI